MVQEGYLKSDSQRGIWEIAEKGRNALKNDQFQFDFITQYG